MYQSTHSPFPTVLAAIASIVGSLALYLNQAKSTSPQLPQVLSSKRPQLHPPLEDCPSLIRAAWPRDFQKASP